MGVLLLLRLLRLLLVELLLLLLRVGLSLAILWASWRNIERASGGGGGPIDG